MAACEPDAKIRFRMDKTYPAAQTVAEVKRMKEEEKKPLSWEAADPRLPVIQSGHMENKRNLGQDLR